MTGSCETRPPGVQMKTAPDVSPRPSKSTVWTHREFTDVASTAIVYRIPPKCNPVGFRQVRTLTSTSAPAVLPHWGIRYRGSATGLAGRAPRHRKVKATWQHTRLRPRCPFLPGSIGMGRVRLSPAAIRL